MPGSAKRRSVATIGGVIAVFAVAALLSACGSSSSSSGSSTNSGGAAASSATTPSASGKQATLRLDYSPEIYQEPFFYAQKQGWYKQAEIDLTIQPGQGSGTTVTLVGQGKNTFGFADSGTMMLATSKGVPVKSIAVIERKATFGVECFASEHVTQPSQLNGKSVLLIPSESTASYWPAFLKDNSLTSAEVHVVNADYSDKVKLMAAHRADCMAGVLGQDLVQVKLLNSQIGNPIPFYAHGITAVGMSLIASNSTISSDPAMVKKFVSVSIRGFKWMCANQQQALSDFFASQSGLSAADKEFQKAEEASECQKLKPGSGDSGTELGPTMASVWNAMQTVLHATGGLSTTKPVSAYFTNQFVSAAG